MARAFSAAGSTVRRWCPRTSNSQAMSVRMASGPTPRPWAAVPTKMSTARREVVGVGLFRILDAADDRAAGLDREGLGAELVDTLPLRAPPPCSDLGFIEDGEEPRQVVFAHRAEPGQRDRRAPAPARPPPCARCSCYLRDSLPPARQTRYECTNPSRSPSSTLCALPTSWPVRVSFTIWYGCRT